MAAVLLEISEGIATITLNKPKSLNSFNNEDFYDLADALRTVDKRDDVLVTIWQANGKFFSTGLDFSSQKVETPKPTVRQAFLAHIAHTSAACGNAFSSHSKILVAAVNGPVIGIAAGKTQSALTSESDKEYDSQAFLGYFDFIYCLPNVQLSLPLTFLGMVPEGGSSISFVNKMGLAKANEVLLWGKKKGSQELLECGFVNQIFPAQPVDSFHAAVRKLVLDELQGLDPVALLESKKLIHAGLKEKNDPDAANTRECFAQAARFASGVPYEQTAKLTRKEIKFKL